MDRWGCNGWGNRSIKTNGLSWIEWSIPFCRFSQATCSLRASLISKWQFPHLFEKFESILKSKLSKQLINILRSAQALDNHSASHAREHVRFVSAKQPTGTPWESTLYHYGGTIQAVDCEMQPWPIIASCHRCSYSRYRIIGNSAAVTSWSASTQLPQFAEYANGYHFGALILRYLISIRWIIAFANKLSNSNGVIRKRFVFLWTALVDVRCN